jgi:hypothetical protein
VDQDSLYPDTDPDPAFQVNPDPAFQVNPDPDPIRIQVLMTKIGEKNEITFFFFLFLIQNCTL